MKYDMLRSLKGEDGYPLMEGNEHFTTGMAIRRALLADYVPKDSPDLKSDEKAARFTLWKKLSDTECGFAEISLEEAALIKRCVLGFRTLVYGQLVDFLEGN